MDPETDCEAICLTACKSSLTRRRRALLVVASFSDSISLDALSIGYEDADCFITDLLSRSVAA